MNKRFTLASLAIVLGICAFIFFTQTQVLTVSRPAVHAQSAYGVRAVKMSECRIIMPWVKISLIMIRCRKESSLSVSRLMKPW